MFANAIFWLFNLFQKFPAKIMFPPITENYFAVANIGFFFQKRKSLQQNFFFFNPSFEFLLKVLCKTITGAGRGMRPAAPSLPLQERSEEGGARLPAAEMRQD
jgi:hypothetical protein